MTATDPRLSALTLRVELVLVSEKSIDGGWTDGSFREDTLEVRLIASGGMMPRHWEALLNGARPPHATTRGERTGTRFGIFPVYRPVPSEARFGSAAEWRGGNLLVVIFAGPPKVTRKRATQFYRDTRAMIGARG